MLFNSAFSQYECFLQVQMLQHGYICKFNTNPPMMFLIPLLAHLLLHILKSQMFRQRMGGKRLFYPTHLFEERMNKCFFILKVFSVQTECLHELTVKALYDTCVSFVKGSICSLCWCKKNENKQQPYSNTVIVE